jgi:hypothetical protein
VIQALRIVEPRTDTPPQIPVHAQYQSDRKRRTTKSLKMSGIVELGETRSSLKPELVTLATQKCQFLSAASMSLKIG